jgi:type IV secretory pathway TrbF-like protein
MEKIEIFKIILFALSFIITTAIPFIIKLASTIKAKKSATTEAEKQSAHNDMVATLNGFIADAEVAFKGFDALMRQQQNTTAGAMKKDTVLTKLQAYALSHGYEFDAEYWSQKIDDIVAFTKKVNAK